MPNGNTSTLYNILFKGRNNNPIDNTAVNKNLPLNIKAKRLATVSTQKTQPISAVNISDNRTVDGVTKQPLSSKNKFSVNADQQVMKDIISAAKTHGIDPYTALAIGLQETNLSGYGDNEENTFHVLNNADNFYGKTPSETTSNAVKMLKDKIFLAKRLGKTDEASVIQSWNGYGKVGSNTEGQQKKMYGLDVSKQPLDMNTNPVYGKRIIDLRENVIKKNPQIVKMVNSL